MFKRIPFISVTSILSFKVVHGKEAKYLFVSIKYAAYHLTFRLHGCLFLSESLFLFECEFTGENTTLNPSYNNPQLGFLYFLLYQTKSQTDTTIPNGLPYKDTEYLHTSLVSLLQQDSC